MIRVVFDTNVLASGIVRPNSLIGDLMRWWSEGAFDLVVSSAILGELGTTLEDPYFQRHLSVEERTASLAVITREAIMTPLSIPVAGVATHHEDDLILATAVSGQATHLVTGDGQLQQLRVFRGVEIVSPRAFLDLISVERHDARR